MNSPPPRSRGSAIVGRGASFARAAAHLDEAAAKLSAAAEAMSAAAAMFSSIAPAFKLAPVGVPGTVVVEQPTQTLAPNREISVGHVSEEECTNPEDSDYWSSDQEESTYVDPKRDYTSQPSQRASNLAPPRPGTTLQRGLHSPAPTLAPGGKPTELYRILVDHEGDVLLTVCSLIQYYKRMVCYMACGLNVIAIYGDLIESVTGTTIYTVTKSSATHMSSVASKFFEDENAILMLPETISPDIQPSTSTDLCVIHVDWPSDQDRYKKQIDVHRAQTNVLVAFSEDSNLYPSGSSILLGTTPWSTHEKPIQPTNALRLLFDQNLSDISAEKKESIYVDWISCHGPCGSRYVESWDAINLVHHANLYILDVLRYKNAEPASHNAPFQVALPRVSPGFVTHNKLELAVEDGVLHVRSGPDSKNTFSISKDEILARGATSLNEIDNSRRPDSTPPPDFREGASGVNESEHSIPKSDTPEVPEHLPDSTEFYPTGFSGWFGPVFQPVPGHSYITIQEEFDAIPAVCYLANLHRRLVYFLDDGAALVHYRSLLSGIVNHKIYYPEVAKDPSAVENAAKSFISQPPPTILLLSVNTKNLPPALTNMFIDCVVHRGSLSHALKHYKKMTCSSGYVIMTTAQRDKQLEKGPMKIESAPRSELFRAQGTGSLLESLRDTTKSVLLSKKKLVQQMYRARVIHYGKIPRRVVSAEQVAEKANTYAARILLHGSIEDGNETLKPIGGRPSVSKSIVSSFDLQPAVELGLLSVN